MMNRNCLLEVHECQLWVVWHRHALELQCKPEAQHRVVLAERVEVELDLTGRHGVQQVEVEEEAEWEVRGVCRQFMKEGEGEEGEEQEMMQMMSWMN